MYKSQWTQGWDGIEIRHDALHIVWLSEFEDRLRGGIDVQVGPELPYREYLQGTAEDLPGSDAKEPELSDDAIPILVLLLQNPII